jgi:hypothetical protein
LERKSEENLEEVEGKEARKFKGMDKKTNTSEIPAVQNRQQMA